MTTSPGNILSLELQFISSPFFNLETGSATRIRLVAESNVFTGFDGSRWTFLHDGCNAIESFHISRPWIELRTPNDSVPSEIAHQNIEKNSGRHEGWGRG